MSTPILIPNVFVLVEGRTEETYINHLKERGCNYSLHVERFNGNQPLKMVKRCASRFRERGMDRRYGDLAFCVFDVDDNSLEDLVRASEYAEKHHISLIVSNPCFEIFFLFHFTDGLPLNSASETKSLVCEHIKGYTETMDCWHILLKKKDGAVERTRRYGGIADIEQGVAGTNIWMLFDALTDLRNRKGR